MSTWPPSRLGIHRACTGSRASLEHGWNTPRSGRAGARGVSDRRSWRTMPRRALMRFGSGSFDIAYATNSLDHSADPFTIISNMVAVVRAGGVVLLRHKRNEGESARYGGLHQWNFDVINDDLLVWNDAVEVNVGSAL